MNEIKGADNLGKPIGRNFLKFLIVIIAFQDVAAGVAGSIMADIIAAYPNFDPTIVMLVATFPGLIQIVPALFYGQLSSRFKKRTLLFTGLVLFMIGGVMPFFIDSLPLIILFRGILGLGVGITMPLSIDIISDFFEGREKDTLIGLGTSTIACIGAIFFQLVGGILADAYGWQYGFLTYLFPIWILALTFLFLPEPERRDKPNATVKDLFKAPKQVYGFSLGQVIYSAFIFGYVTNISIVIQAEGLGNATEAGLAVSIFTFGTLIAGLIFGRLRSRFPVGVVPMAVFITGVGMLICYSANSLSAIFIGSLVGGFAMGLVLPGVFARVSELSEQKGVSYVGLVVVGQGLGGISGPFLYGLIMQLFNQQVGNFALLISTVGLILLSIVWYFFVKAPKEKVSPDLSL
ncbi:MFS family permease [Lysinibacillus composti]|uniref:MFS transporter n=1 Tax=Lysinibacillus composti TaxID=720633 RepID=A0A3N9UP96_9BACI|nr:MFS transporter [Lysinibacillus composti]MBM7609410.1 MFS family permease [Lysinibacillus composti]RQW74352.1 MFS transporter [Lysinibacillus composti]